MAATEFEVRQFYNVPSGYGTFTAPSGVFIVTGSISRLLVNDNRTNLASNSMTITTQYDGPYVANSGTNEGWWPGTLTDFVVEDGEIMPGTIVGGADGYENEGSDNRTSTVSVWGFSASYSQEGGVNQTNLNAAFIALAGSILGTTFANTGSAKTALRNAGFYYQYPIGYDGQSPNTGRGSDIIG